MTTGHPAIHELARRVDHLALLYRRAHHVLDELWTTIDWHPASTLGDGTPHGTDVNDPTHHAVINMADLNELRTGIEQWRANLADVINGMERDLVKITRRSPPEKVPVVFCNGKIIERKCENAASVHRVHDPHDGTTTVYEGTCDQCWLLSCSRCHERPIMSGRTIELNGRRVPACEACARKEWRATRAVA